MSLHIIQDIYDDCFSAFWLRSSVASALISLIKVIYDKPVAVIILSGKKMKLFLEDQEQDRDAHYHHLYSTSY